MPCPLCASSSCVLFHRDTRREYLRCDTCHLVFVPPEFHLTAVSEKAEYDKHINSPEDAAYRKFLSRIANPLHSVLKPHSQGLDFGCGPGPTLSVMLQEQGHSVSLYDVFYANDPRVLTQNYDFVSATEVLEHLSQPKFELDRLWGQILGGGYLAVMTKLVIDKDAFSNWHYKNDLTHISFFSESTFDWLAERWGARWERYASDAFIFFKP